METGRAGIVNGNVVVVVSGRYVTVWVCPKCGNYYGSSTVEKVDLSTAWNAQNDQRTGYVPTHPRSQCPECKTQRVKRQAFITGEV